MRTIFSIRLLTVAVASAMLSLSSFAEKRAFIVGVGEYAELTDLQKTEGDATGYTNLFGNELGYTVSTVGNQKKRRDFVAAFDAFVRSISPGDEVVFIFSGHGWSDGGDNYLSFSDAPKGQSEAVLISETIALEKEVMARLRARNPKVLLSIIDACRDENYEPLTKSNGSLSKGIVRISANEGELILYSAAAGQTSLDRLSNNDTAKYSVFTRVLLPRLSDTSKPLARIANETRTEVQRLAGTISHRQRPEMMLGIDLDFCLSGNCKVGSAAPARAAVPSTDPREKELWTKVLADGSVPALEKYLEAYPSTPNAETARTLIRLKSDKIARDEAFQRRNTPAATLADETSDTPGAAVSTLQTGDLPPEESIYLKPGLWGSMMTVRGTMTRNGAAMPPQVAENSRADCREEADAFETPETMVANFMAEGGSAGMTCELVDAIVNGQNMAAQIRCTDMEASLEGFIDMVVNEDGESAETRMEASGQVRGNDFEVEVTSFSQWTGACDAEETISVTAGN